MASFVPAGASLVSEVADNVEPGRGAIIDLQRTFELDDRGAARRAFEEATTAAAAAGWVLDAENTGSDAASTGRRPGAEPPDADHLGISVMAPETGSGAPWGLLVTLTSGS